MAATVTALALLALAVWGVPGLSVAWPALTVVASLVSMALLVLAIDIDPRVVAVTRPDWVERLMT